jgi:hypothetical protein
MGRIFEHAEQYLDQLTPGSEFVEIGSSRNGDGHLRVGGDGGSTVIIAGWAQCRNQILHTIDVDPEQIQLVEQFNIPNIQTYCETGEEWLCKKIYNPLHPIGFLYLDNFDWDWHPEQSEDFVVEQQRRYQSFGLEMNNVNSQRAHLTQAILAVHHMAPASLIVCDDTWYNKWWGHYSGKSGSAIPFLLNHGYQVIYTEEQPVYGTILGRGIVKK